MGLSLARYSSHHFRTVDAWDFPGGPVVKNLPSNTEDTGSIPGWETMIPHAVGQLSPCTSTMEPGALEPVGHN